MSKIQRDYRKRSSFIIFNDLLLYICIDNVIFFNGHKDFQVGLGSDRICNLLAPRIRIPNLGPRICRSRSERNIYGSTTLTVIVFLNNSNIFGKTTNYDLKREIAAFFPKVNNISFRRFCEYHTLRAKYLHENSTTCLGSCTYLWILWYNKSEHREVTYWQLHTM